MRQENRGYLVTNASIYTGRPIITEHRLRVIEEEAPPELGPFAKFICECLGLALGLGLSVLAVKFVFWLIGL